MDIEEEMEMEIDSFKYLTPCLTDIVKNYSDYVQNDSIIGNEDYYLEQIFRLQLDSTYYFGYKQIGKMRLNISIQKNVTLFATIMVGLHSVPIVCRSLEIALG